MHAEPDTNAFDLISLRDVAIPERVSLCRAFYEGVYKDAFPIADEAEDCETWLPLLAGESGSPRLEILLACDKPKDGPALSSDVLGGIVFEFYGASNAWLVTYLAVRPKERRRGIAVALFASALETIGLSKHRGREKPLVFAEAENPKLVASSATKSAYQRLQVLDALGLLRVDVPYIQPALDAQKRPLDTLFLLTYESRDEPATSIPADRLRRFLIEFYAALDQSHAPELRSMLASFEHRSQLGVLPLALSVPSIYDESLGRARSITVQLLYFDDLLSARAKALPSKKSSDRIDLKALRSAIAATPFGADLTSGVASYHRDIVVPFLSEGSRPLIISCEAFASPADIGAGDPHRPPTTVWIDLPATVAIEWEERTVTLPFTDPAGPNSAASIPAAFTDFVTIFESGICAYGLSIVLEPDALDVATNASVLLLLESLVGAAGETKDGPLFRMRGMSPSGSDIDEPGLPLDTFLRTRLMAQRSADANAATIFSIFRANAPALPTGLEEKLSTFAFGDTYETDRRAPNFVAVEVVGSDHHDTVLQYAKGARERNVPIDRFSKRLAGIVQNVMDFEQQDAVEVQDSLMLNWPSGSEITFVHAKAMVWFARYRRSYFEAREKIGSDPYWLLTRLILGHNEQLLVRLRDELEDLDDRETDAVPEIDRITERIRRLRRRMDRYIQNPFRYDSEQTMFTFVSDVRGIEQQRLLIAAEEQAMAARIAEDAANVKEVVDAKINNTIIAIGLFQAAGVFVAVLGLQLAPLWFESRAKAGADPPLIDYAWPWLIVFGLAIFLALMGAFTFIRGPARRSRRNARRRTHGSLSRSNE